MNPFHILRIFFGDGPVIALLLIFAAVIIYVLLQESFKFFRMCMRAKWWPHTEGTIVRSEVEVTILSVDPSDEDPVTSEFAVVEYLFVVDGKERRSRVYSIGGRTAFPLADNAPSQAVKNYPVGSRVTVFYNPKDPKDCALNRDIPIGKALFSAGLILGVMAIAPAYIYLRTPAISYGREFISHLTAYVREFFAR